MATTPTAAGPPLASRLIPRTQQPAPMVTDLLAGNLLAGFALLEWLEEHDQIPVRRHQHTCLRVAFGALVTNARAVEAVAGHPYPPDYLLAAPTRPELVWRVFCESVRHLFTLDLYAVGDVIGFLDAVIRPAELAAATEDAA